MIVWNLLKRNLKVFFRDKSSVFFSLLAVFIIIGLYVLFLRDTIMTGFEGMGDDAVHMLDNWIMAGMLAVTAITTTMGAFGIMVEDRAKNIMRDFTTAPIRRTSLVLGYVTSAFVVGMIMSLAALVLAEIYVAAYGGSILTLFELLQVILIMLLSVFASSAMVFFMVSFFKSVNAFTTASTVLGTMIGFVTGIYIPIGNLPSAVQFIIKIFPISHAGALFRQVMMARPIEAAFAGAPVSMVGEFEQEMGVSFNFGGESLGPWGSVAILAVTAVVFFALATWNMSRKNR